MRICLKTECFFLEQDIQNAIEDALKKCKEKGISGKLVTPFILDQVREITKGRSLDSSWYIFVRIFTIQLAIVLFIELVFTDIALIRNNAVVGSKIAVALKTKEFL